MMSRIKVNSIGFGNDKNIKLSDRLMAIGVALTIAGMMINYSKTQWWVAGDQKTLDTVRELYDAQNS